MHIQMFYLFASLCTKQYVGRNTLGLSYRNVQNLHFSNVCA